MAQRIVVDPITRIEGHLRIEADINDGIISDAFSSGTMIRGIELIVRDRDPRDVWAFVARVCGVCTSIHGLAGVRVIENAFNITIPPNAEQVRNLMQAALFIQDHIFHFYTLSAFDWVDIMSALKGDPKEAADIAASISTWPRNSEGDFALMLEKLKKFAASGQLGFLSNAYWGHPAYKLSPSENLMAVTHYFQTFDEMKDVVRIQTIFGGKNPHPNFLVGGMGCAININDPSAINLERLSWVANVIQRAQMFVSQVYLPDVIAILSRYPEWTKIGGGLSNYLAYGDFPMGNYGELDTYQMVRGIVRNRDLSKVYPFDPEAQDGLQEFVAHAWYNYTERKDKGLHPSKGETILNYSGPNPPYDFLDVDKSYSWIKTPRYKGEAMETGPLARMIVNYAAGNKPVVELVDASLKKMGCSLDCLYSTAGRILGRAIECQIVSNLMTNFYDALIGNIKKGDYRMFNGQKWEPSSWPDYAVGYSLTEAPRGALAHYAEVKDKRISNYQMVMPTTWNGSPRDAKGQHSAFEASLIGTPVADSSIPLEILRTIHSFDPCLACAVHLNDEKGSFIHRVETK
ncbi:MAG: nickel-dependent hydrogenase large subunit [Bacteroidales bacterium]|nr:nickel-dependent hydrogenase large subunit [Bacteroidales bacterium]